MIDEIDKAEPDVPNDLLEVIGSQMFRVLETGTSISLKKKKLNAAKDYPLIVITTNQERELPPAFIRRCIVYRFTAANETQLKEIAKSTLRNTANIDLLCSEVLSLYSVNDLPQVAEFLDTLIAAAALMEQPEWSMEKLKEIVKLTIDKKTQLMY